MLQAIRQNPQDESFDAGNGLLPVLAVSQGTGNGGDFRDPAIVFFLFGFYHHTI